MINVRTAFPRVEVESRLRNELSLLVQQQATVRGQVLPSDANALSTKVIDIDSLGVIEILCVLDGVLPFLVDESVVKAGGYSSIQQAIADLLPKVENRWRKHQERAA